MQWLSCVVNMELAMLEDMLGNLEHHFFIYYREGSSDNILQA